MVFAGTTFLGIKYTALPTAVFSKDETYVAEYGGFFSQMEVLKDVSDSPSPEFTERWGWATIMKADYSTEKTTAGNTDWTIETVSQVAVKRRIKGTFDWTTIEVRDINEVDDFKILGIDKFNKADVTYEYAIVPYLDGNAGTYNVEEIKSYFDAIFIVGKDKTYKTFSTSGNIDTTRNIPGTPNVPYNSKYPTFFSAGLMNYDSGSLDGKFYDLDSSCGIIKDEGYAYKKGLMDFLTDRKPKVLKHSDGRIWLIQVMPSPTDSADGDYKIRNITFEWIQIGEADKLEDLYYAGLTDLAEEWWN